MIDDGVDLREAEIQLPNGANVLITYAVTDEHVDLPGERDQADRFNRACGVPRP